MYKSLKAVIADRVMKNLREMSWKCQGCPRVHECEDLVRYCGPMIEAAINEHPNWPRPQA